MVRLKASQDYNVRLINEFQFQYGTIKRWERLEQYILKTYFNSNMVRLKVVKIKN